MQDWSLPECNSAPRLGYKRRLGLKGSKVTNALAYHGSELITAVKCFIVQVLG
jgi:hypothetical protein